MKKRTSNRSFAAIFLILLLFLSFSHVSAASGMLDPDRTTPTFRMP